MEPNLWIAVLVAIAVIGAAAWIYMQRSRSEHLRSRFGPEYEVALRRHGDRSTAEKELEQRAKRVQVMRVRPLTTEDHERFVSAWKQNQAHFVDNPAESIREADDLVCEVMKARGYPMEDFELRAADLSVDHPHVVRNYRAAHEIVARHSSGQASTEDLRQALIYYRDLIDELLEAQHGRLEVH